MSDLERLLTDSAKHNVLTSTVEDSSAFYRLAAAIAAARDNVEKVEQKQKYLYFTVKSATSLVGKIEAIKFVRVWTKVGLPEAKKIVEQSVPIVVSAEKLNEFEKLALRPKFSNVLIEEF